MTRYWPHLALCSILLAISIFFLATLRPGHTWADDFALYILHARNIVEGRPYADTGYIHNPSSPSYSPASYPPGFPLLLAPVYWAFGASLTAMKVELVAVFIACLAVIYYSFRPRLTEATALALVALVGFNPLLWQFKDRILSDLPFLLCAYAGLALYDRAGEAHSWRSRLTFALMASAAMYAAYAIRAIGVILVGALLIHDLIRHRRPTLTTVVALLVFSSLYAAQLAFLQVSAAVYADQVSNEDVTLVDSLLFALRSIPMRAIVFSSRLSALFDNGYAALPRVLLFGVFCVLATRGFWLAATSNTRRGRIWEVFAAVYLVPVIMWPSNQEWRLLIPIFPLFFFYALSGLSDLAKREWTQRLPLRHGGWYVLAVPVLLAVASYGVRYSREEFGAVEGVGTQDAQRLFAYVARETAPADVIVFRRARALVLFTGRRASTYRAPEAETLPTPAADAGDQPMRDYLSAIGASYLITGTEFPSDVAFLLPFVARNAHLFEEVYAVDGFTVYRIHVPPVIGVASTP